MATADGRYIISYNGEVFNCLELRAQLEALGRTFRSRSDSEVVLNALAQWGLGAINRFNGMFALALWDSQDKKLLLARDRYGIKPLYYTFTSDSLLFGSEVKALLAHGAYRASMDLEALLEYFTFQNFFTDRTLFENVRILPAGCYMEVRADDPRSAKPVRYWDWHFSEDEQQCSQEEYLEELDRLFRQAVSRQLLSDVPIGSYLSGGMDSGSITALAATSLPYIKTFTCGFDMHSASGLELAFDERVNAELMSYLFRTEHYEMVLKAGDMERIMPEMAWHLEEPRVGQSYPNYYAAKLASKFVKVVLSGGGGDELFGGYPWRYYRAAVNDDFEHYIDKYYLYWQRLIPNRMLQLAFKPVWSSVKGVWTRDIFRDVFHEHAAQLTRAQDYVNHSLYFEAKTFLHGLLVMEDKLSMAHGLETRVPFLDNDLVDFAMKVPVKYKLGNLNEVVRISENEPGKERKYFERTRDGKLLLRKAMARLVPDEISNGVKQGFSGPDATWFKGQSIEYVRRTLNDPKARIYEFLDKDVMWSMVEEHIQGKCNRRLLIWSLLSVENFCRQFL